MNTLLNSSSGNKKYIFKDGVLDPSYPLSNGFTIRNNMIYTNNAGGTNWIINTNVEQNTILNVKLICTADAGSSGNEAYCSVNYGGNIGVIRFQGNDEINKPLKMGVYAMTTATTIIIYMYTYGNAMAIQEMWLESY